MIADQLRWYVNRASRMSPAETVSRARDHLRRRAWRSRQVHVGEVGPPLPTVHPLQFATTLDPWVPTAVGESSRVALLKAADELLTGRWEVLGATRLDLDAPDWFRDPTTGRRAPHDRYAFRIRHRSESETGNVKQVWEVSRHQHLTLLAAAWYLTAEPRYAEATAAQLRSWWQENPFLSGVHWTSGIEIGLRLIAWTWIRRLLDGWDGVHDLFERNHLAVRQIYWHQQYLDGFRSSGSSANNHVIAEAAGQLVASCAMPWFQESARWRDDARRLLEREAVANTFASGVNRELATEYQVFVAELLYLAAVESERAGIDLDDTTWATICNTTDAAAAIVDSAGRPPRQGDGDDGRALLLDDPEADRWSGLLAMGARVFEPREWWPQPTPTVLSTLVGSLSRAPRHQPARPRQRPSHFADAGLTLLRTAANAERPELWCRADGGPHGFLSTAAHAHADALSIEIRHGGVEILADPGTYCYHGEAAWRRYFRSTIAHNTVELGGVDQSRSGGPFLWVRHARTTAVAVVTGADGEVESWAAEHDGYATLDPPATHRRTVTFDRAGRRFDIVDVIDTEGVHALRLGFLLGPDVAVADGSEASLGSPDAHVDLAWPSAGSRASATLHLPGALRWEVHRGEVGPILGWYSRSFGVKQPTIAIIGTGVSSAPSRRLESALVFHD